MFVAKNLSDFLHRSPNLINVSKDSDLWSDHQVVLRLYSSQFEFANQSHPQISNFAKVILPCRLRLLVINFLISFNNSHIEFAYTHLIHFVSIIVFQYQTNNFHLHRVFLS